MPAATKIIPFPRPAKPRVLSTRSRIGEFAALSEIILNKRGSDGVEQLVLPARAADAMIPNRLP